MSFTLAQWEDMKGTVVNVRWRPGDYFTHDFTGIVKGRHDKYVMVADEDGDVWDCVPSQLTFNSDAYVH